MIRLVTPFIFMLLFFLPASSYSQARTHVEVFKIHYQNAKDLEGAVKAVLSSSGTVTIVPNANAIVVRDYKYNLKLARGIIAKLDSQPKSINISVDFIEEAELLQAGISINWRVGTSGWSIGTIPSPGNGASINLNALISSLTVKRKQFLEILENREGKIFVGESVPFTDYYFRYGVNYGYISHNTTFKNAGTSFSVTAKTLPNKKIKVILMPEVSYFDRRLKTFSVENASTEVIINDPGRALIGSSAGEEESFGSKFLMGAGGEKKRSKFVIILSARSE